MRRAVETVELLFPDAKDKIILADLRENAFGEFEGRKVTELVQDAHFKQWMDPAQHYTPEGGEPVAEFHKRCSDVLMGMFEFMMKSNISEAACVTHGGVIMSMLAQRGMPRWASMLMMTPPWVTHAASEILLFIINSNMPISTSEQRLWNSATGSPPSGV